MQALSRFDCIIQTLFLEKESWWTVIISSRVKMSIVIYNKEAGTIKMSSVIYNKEERVYYFECPHCQLLCQVSNNDLNCEIFRHAVTKDNMLFIDPHTPKEKCEELVSSGSVWGCGKPFKFDGTSIKICDYI